MCQRNRTATSTKTWRHSKLAKLRRRPMFFDSIASALGFTRIATLRAWPRAANAGRTLAAAGAGGWPLREHSRRRPRQRVHIPSVQRQVDNIIRLFSTTPLSVAVVVSTNCAPPVTVTDSDTAPTCRDTFTSAFC